MLETTKLYYNFKGSEKKVTKDSIFKFFKKSRTVMETRKQPPKVMTPKEQNMYPISFREKIENRELIFTGYIYPLGEMKSDNIYLAVLNNIYLIDNGAICPAEKEFIPLLVMVKYQTTIGCGCKVTLVDTCY